VEQQHPDQRSHARSDGRRARPTAPWRLVFAAFFVTFLVMLAAIYWIIRTGKL
jgi:hypothetical protein